MADQEADAMQTDPRDERIAVLERRLQEAEQRRHQSQDALTMRIEQLEARLRIAEEALFMHPLPATAWKDFIPARVPFASAPMYQHQEKANRVEDFPGPLSRQDLARVGGNTMPPIGYIADHFNEPEPTQPAGPGRRIGWLYVSDELMEKPDLMERLLAGGTVLRRKRRGGDYGLLIERDEFDPYEGDEDSAPLYTVTIDIYGGVEWRRA